MDVTATVIAAIISLIAIVGFSLKISNDSNKQSTKYAITQAEIKIQLTQIQIDVKKLNEAVCMRDNRIENLEKNVFEIQTKCQYIQDDKKK